MPSRASVCRCLSITAVPTSLVLLVAGILGLTIGPGLLQKFVNSQLPLTVGSSQLDSWSTPPVPIYLQFWLWECINPTDVLKGAKPYLQERGPFTYLEHRVKTEVRFNENFTVTYRQKIAYTFLRNMSVDDESIPITMINVPMVTIVSMIRNQSRVVQELLNLIDQFAGENLFVTHTAAEWLWGYEDPLLKAAKAVTLLQPFLVGVDDHFGFFYNNNGSDDGLYTVFTGGDDINNLNIINKWNGNSSLTFWGTKYGNMINGTDGSWVPPLFQNSPADGRIYLYSTQICRSIYAKFESDSSVRGISTNIWTVPDEVFLNATLNPDNAAFGTSDSGILDVGVCNKGAPIIISLPHLLYASDRYKKAIDGIHPDPVLHRTVLQIEPHTGLVISAQKRLQVNVHIQPDPYFDELKNVKEVILPAMWINESTTIDQKSADDLNSQVLQFFTIVHWLSIVFIILAGILLIVAIIFLARRRHGTKPALLFNGGANNDTLASDGLQ